MRKRLFSILKPVLILTGILLLGAVTGTLVKWLNEPQILQDWIDDGFRVFPLSAHIHVWESVLHGSIYSLALFGTLLGTRKLAYRFISLQSWKGIALHITFISVAVVIVFLLVMRLDPYICLLIFGHVPGDGPPASIVTVVALGTTLIISMVMYSVDFYRGMRHAERTALVSELRALRAQINPHFLFNTLNSIAALVHSRPDEAEHVVEELAELFRYTLRASQHATVSMSEDLKASERYIAIEKARFRDRMIITREIDSAALDAQIPSLLIQPLIENAVKHGVSQIEDQCAILINIIKQENRVRIRIRDTGPGFSSTDPSEVFVKGTGLANVRDRLHLHFGIHASCTILKDGVELIFPYRPASEKQADLAPYISNKYH